MSMKQAANYRTYWSSKLPELTSSSVILEVGAGIGSNLALFLEKEIRVVALEPDSYNRDIIKKEHAEWVKNGFLRVISNFSELTSEDKFDLLVYIDVLEHIYSDNEELQRSVKFIQTSGHLLVIVPAHPSLFSEFDKSIGHFRRYSNSSLKKIIPEELQIKYVGKIDPLGLFGVIFNKFFRRKNVSIKQVEIWDKFFVPISWQLDKVVTKGRVGKSIILLAQNEN